MDRINYGKAYGSDVGDIKPNMYDDRAVNIEEQETMTTISLEDLDPSQTIGNDNVDEPCAPDEAFIFDDGYETPDEDIIDNDDDTELGEGMRNQDYEEEEDDDYSDEDDLPEDEGDPDELN